jgi:mannose-1-phosphate guanylyltransferase/mannose-6-phosphate isomerase
MKNTKSVILAGGSGTRLWPLSREKYPKQFLKFDKTSLFQNTIDRCMDISSPNDIFVVTNDAQKFLVIGQIKELGIIIPDENILIEPFGKNTLPAICLGMKEIERRYGESIVGIFPSDHILGKAAMGTIASAESLSKDYLVAFGIAPSCPHTGYGYICLSDPIGVGHKVSAFVEKPVSEHAEKLMNDGCLWNSGMFLFDTTLFFSELQKHEPEIFRLFAHFDNLKDVYNDLQPISVDYGMMEKSDCVAVVKLNDKWTDLGNFDAIYDEFEKDNSNNVCHDCDNVMINSTNNYVYSKANKLVSLIDISNTIIVDTPDALLVCPRDSNQRVKEIVEQLKARNDSRAYLHDTVYKPWGTYTVLIMAERHKIKSIMVLPGKKLSLQLHYHRNEHWAVVKGIALVNVDGKEFFLRTGESTFIKEGTNHRLSNPGRIPLEIIEIQLGEVIDEDDIVRFEDEYGRLSAS